MDVHPQYWVVQFHLVSRYVVFNDVAVGSVPTQGAYQWVAINNPNCLDAAARSSTRDHSIHLEVLQWHNAEHAAHCSINVLRSAPVCT